MVGSSIFTSTKLEIVIILLIISRGFPRFRQNVIKNLHISASNNRAGYKVSVSLFSSFPHSYPSDFHQCSSSITLNQTRIDFLASSKTVRFLLSINSSNIMSCIHDNRHVGVITFT